MSNSLIWTRTLKTQRSWFTIVKVRAYIAANLFTEGCKAHLIIQEMV